MQGQLQLNSVTKHVSRVNKPFLKPIYTISPYTHIKQNTEHKIFKLGPSQLFLKSVHKTNPKHTYCTYTHFQRVSPLNITPFTRAHKAKTCWYHQPF